ncbi:MAG: DUF975 family protein [Oscillospiraceae bacterium]
MNLKKMKSNAKNSIKNVGFKSMLAYVLLGLANALSSTFTDRDSENTTLKIVGILIKVVTIFLSTGFLWYCIEVSRNQSPSLATIFDGFAHAGKVILLSLLVTVKTLLWSLLLIVPGIIKAYSYSMSFYLLHDHPEWTPSQCIEESQRIMNGNKGNLFELQLSFIGWAILGALVISILFTVLSFMGLPTIVINIISFVVLSPLYTYIYVSTANFYNEVSKRTIYNI